MRLVVGGYKDIRNNTTSCIVKDDILSYKFLDFDNLNDK